MMRTSILFLTLVFSLMPTLNVAARAGNPSAGAESGTYFDSSAPVSSGTGIEANQADVWRIAAADDSAEADSTAETDPLLYTRPVLKYDAGGRRDPFESLVPEEDEDEKKIKGLFNYEKSVLRGIVRSGEDVYAMVVDANNYAFVLRENDSVLGGNVTKITDDAVYLHIIQYGRAMNIILRMETARKTVRTSEDDDSVVKRPGIIMSYGSEDETASRISVEDVTVPSLDTRSVEDVWFGSGNGGAQDNGSGGCTLLSPTGNSEIRLPSLLRWTRSEEDSLYTMVIAGDMDFSSPLIVKKRITVNSCVLDIHPALEAGGRFYWKVIALRKSGKQISSRNTLSFRINSSLDRGNEHEKQ